jgi:hypothetical protein
VIDFSTPSIAKPTAMFSISLRSEPSYELQSGGRELYVTLKIENERMPQAISIRSVYDKSE